MPRTRPSELTISVTTSPQPPWRLTRRRNAVSVMPAIGAMAKGDARSTVPIFMTLVGLDIRRVHFNAHRLTDQIHREHEARLRRVLAHQPPDHSAQRSVDHFDHHAFPDQRTRIELQIAADQDANAVELVCGDRRRLPLERYDIDDAGAFQDGQRIGRVESRETVAGKERPVDLLLPILPAAPARDGG